VVPSVRRSANIGTPNDRPCGRYHHWLGQKDGYFASAEGCSGIRRQLTHILVHQKACFNSPVWFSCGIEESPGARLASFSPSKTPWTVLDWYRKGGVIFKGGSPASTF
jgi:ribonucleoside-diphosphate reductase alpha chain